MKKEIFFALLISITVLIFSNLYLSFFADNKGDLVFLGRRVINSQDSFTYMAFIEQAKQGRILFENLYTTEPQTSTLIRPSYTLLGFIAKIFNISSISAYHLGRIIFSCLFFVVLYLFLVHLFKTPKRRLLSYTVVLTSSGLGFLLGRFWPNSSDLWIPESITFLSLQEAPHFILSQVIMLSSFLLLLKTINKGRPIFLLPVFLLLVLLGFEHPYNLVLMLSVVLFFCLYLFYKKKARLMLLIFTLITFFTAFFVIFAYQYFETLKNPTLKSWIQESSSPIPAYYLFGFGLLVPLSFIGIQKYLTEKKLSQVLVLAWIAAGVIILYLPVYFQRRLSEGLHVPIAILASEGIIILSFFISSFVLGKIRKAVRYSFAVIIVLILLIGTYFGIREDIKTIAGDSSSSYYYYLLKNEVSGMNWIKQNTSVKDIVLTNWFYGNILPGISGRKVFLGHKAQTKDFDKKVEQVNKFLINENDKQAVQFLKENKISYIFVGKNDTLLKYGFKPYEKLYLKKVFDEGEVKVYKVKY